MNLYVLSEPPRRLLPSVLLLTGKADGQPFSIALPVDLAVGSPVTISARPHRAFRGKAMSRNKGAVHGDVGGGWNGGMCGIEKGDEECWND